MLQLPYVGRLLALVLALALSAFFAPTAHAQGTSGQLPDPMSTVELSKVLKLYVQPTRDQMAAIEKLHDSYLERFRALRENEIEKFLENTKRLQGGMPTKEQMNDFTKGYDRINKQIAEIDDSFFDAVATLMGDGRTTSVQRAKDSRVRTRSAAGSMSMGMLGASGTVDLSAIVLELGLPPKELEAIDPTLINYEQHLTAGVKELGQMGMRMMKDMFDELEKAGIGNMSQEEMMADPEKMKAVMDAVKASMEKVTQRSSAKVRELSEFNAKTFRALSDQITGDAKRKLRVRFVAKAYPGIPSDPSSAESLFLMALRVKSLAADAKEQIRNAYAQWQTADDAIVDQQMKASDDYSIGRNPMDFGSGMKEQMEKMAQFTTKRAEVGAAAMKSVSPLLGEERVAKLIAKKAKTTDAEFDRTDDPSQEGDEPASIGVGARASEMERQMAMHRLTTDRQPMDASIITVIATQLALDDARKAVLEVMHGDYVKRWEAEVAVLQERIDEAQSKRQTVAQDTHEVTLDSAQQNAYYGGRKAKIAKATEVDGAFFSDLGHALGDDSKNVLHMVQLERIIDRTSGGPSELGAMAMFYGGASETPVNFVVVLRSTELSAEDKAKVTAALIPLIDPLIKTHLDTLAEEIDQERKIEEWGVTNQALYRNQENPDMAALAKVGMEMMAMQQRRMELSTRRSDGVRAAWAAALATLSEGQRGSMQLAFDERAYPSIFKDKRSALPFIQKARELADLTDEQKQQLQLLQERYSAEHLDLCRKMVPKESSAAAPTKPEDMQKYWQAEMERANAREKIRFDRDERSQRAISQLRRVLKDEQIKLIAGLSEYENSAKESRSGPFGRVELE